jgi:hypothetical protein
MMAYKLIVSYEAVLLALQLAIVFFMSEFIVHQSLNRDDEDVENKMYVQLIIH